jgi:hypothetical protein
MGCAGSTGTAKPVELLHTTGTTDEKHGTRLLGTVSCSDVADMLQLYYEENARFWRLMKLLTKYTS